MQLNEKKKSSNNPLKIKFDSSMEFLDKKETKKNEQKNFHLYVFEEIPVIPGTPGSGTGKNALQFTYRPLIDC